MVGKPCGMDAKLPKEDCDAQLRRPIVRPVELLICADQGSAPLSARYSIHANSQKHKFDH
jgi:hypothetical protein